MLTVDAMHSWAAGPMAEMVEDPMHQADMAIIEAAGMFPTVENTEARAAVERIRARSMWCYEEGGRRYAAALREYRARQEVAWQHVEWWRG